MITDDNVTGFQRKKKCRQGFKKNNSLVIKQDSEAECKPLFLLPTLNVQEEIKRDHRGHDDLMHLVIPPSPEVGDNVMRWKCYIFKLDTRISIGRKYQRSKGLKYSVRKFVFTCDKLVPRNTNQKLKAECILVI